MRSCVVTWGWYVLGVMALGSACRTDERADAGGDTAAGSGGSEIEAGLEAEAEAEVEAEVGVEVDGAPADACVVLAADPEEPCEPHCRGEFVMRCERWTDAHGCTHAAQVGRLCGGMTCAMDAALGIPLCVDKCQAMDAAQGPTACELPLGYGWNGAACVAISCSCIGTDCDKLDASEDACIEKHATCSPDWTAGKKCTSSGGWWWEDSGTCNCGDGGAWDPVFGCWPRDPNLCDATNGWWYQASCGGFCGFCGCGLGTGWRAGLGCIAPDYTADIDLRVGGSLSGAGATVRIPPNSLASNALPDGNITFGFMVDAPDAATPQREQIVGSIFRLAPFVNAAFDPPATLALPIPPSVAPTDTVVLAERGFSTPDHWTAIPTVIIDGQVVGQIRWLSTFAVMVTPAP